MSHNPLPPVKKTKKSSFRPLSKLNGDSLTDLTRMEKPEYTKRVFFYNTSSRARLQNKVNVWFRDHLHTMTLINRQQQVVFKQMCRVQKDHHHAKREEYKRKQREMRSNMKKMQVEQLQRRVIQRFRRNAHEKMSSRGLESLAGLRLQAQKRPSIAANLDETAEESQSVARRMLGSIIVDFTAAVDSGDIDPVDDNGGEKKAMGSSEPGFQDSEGRERCAANFNNKDDGKSERKDEDSDLSRPAQSAATKTPASGKTVEEEGGSGRPPAKDKVSQDLKPPVQQTGAKTRPAKLSVAATESFPLDVIPEVRTPPPNTPSNDARDADAHPGDNFPVSIGGKVVEVRKNQPNSPTTRTVNARTRRKTYGTLPAYDPSNSKDQEIPEDDHLSQGSSRCTITLNPIPFSSLVTSQAPPEFSTTPGVNEIRDEKKSVTFSRVPSRDEAMQDVAIFLAGREEDEEEEEEGGEVRRERETKSLAARIKMERKHEAKRRAKVLDSEPLVQYYRSVRGTLQPLMTEPTRRSYPMPSGKFKYQQNKLLREEHQKDLARRGNIDKFFTDLFTRNIGDPQTAGQEDDASKSPGSAPQGNQLQLLLQKMMRKPSEGPARAVNKNSVEQLTRCQYLRLYDGLSKTPKPREEGTTGEKETSWGTAEKGLKAGFLALDFTGRGY